MKVDIYINIMQSETVAVKKICKCWLTQYYEDATWWYAFLMLDDFHNRKETYLLQIMDKDGESMFITSIKDW